MTTSTHAVLPPAPARGRRRSLWLGALLTSVFVAVGAVVATTTLPRVQSPGDAAKEYIEARYEQEWQTVWTLMCRAHRDVFDSAGDYAEGARRVDEESNSPTSVDVEVDDVSKVRFADPAAGPVFRVSYTVTSDQPGDDVYRYEGQISVIVEDGGLRVCG
jgi:hypothetical protein